MPLRELDLTVGRGSSYIRGGKCSVCGVDLVDAPKPVWSRRSGNSKVRYYCDRCKQEKYSGVLIQ